MKRISMSIVKKIVICFIAIGCFWGINNNCVYANMRMKCWVCNDYQTFVYTGIREGEKDMMKCPNCNNITPYYHDAIWEVVKAEYLASEATCEKAATYYKLCPACDEKGNKTFEYGSPLNHNWGEYTVEIPATCSTDGTMIASCTRTGCTEVDRKPDPARHTNIELVNEVQPTDTEPGKVAHYICRGCEKLFKDPDGNTETNEAELKIKMLCNIVNNNYPTQSTYAGTPIPAPETGNFTANSQASLAFTWYQGSHTQNPPDDLKLQGTPINSGDYTLKVDAGETADYQAGSKLFTITIKKLLSPSSKPDENLNVSYTCKKIGDIKSVLPEKWDWKDEDKNTELNVGETVTVTAVYKGEDAENYEDAGKTVSVRVTRLACTHENTIVRIEEQPATESEKGTAAHYKCNTCEELFKDETGNTTTNMNELVINKLCVIENKDYSQEYTYTGKPILAPELSNFMVNSQEALTFTWYKGKSTQNLSDDLRLEGVPTNAGDYTLKADAGANADYQAGSKCFDIVIKKSADTPEKPGSTLSVPYTCKKVEEITAPYLSEKWVWKEEDKSKELKVGEPLKVTAVYIGDDKENYESETVIEITRSKCEHKKTYDRYWSAPTCTEEGYTGDTYCSDCEELIYSGYTIQPYGHEYDTGTITVYPTTETEGTYVQKCKRCNNEQTVKIPVLQSKQPYLKNDILTREWNKIIEKAGEIEQENILTIDMDGASEIPGNVLAKIKGKDNNLDFVLDDTFTWRINGNDISDEDTKDTDISVKKTTGIFDINVKENAVKDQENLELKIGGEGAFGFNGTLKVNLGVNNAGLIANLLCDNTAQDSVAAYAIQQESAEVIRCTQSVQISENGIAEFDISKAGNYLIVISSSSMKDRVIYEDGSIAGRDTTYIQPAKAEIGDISVRKNTVKVNLVSSCNGAQGYDFVLGKKKNMLSTGKYVSVKKNQKNPKTSFAYTGKGTWYVACHAWIKNAQGEKVFGPWSEVIKVSVKVTTPKTPKIEKITRKGKDITITYTACKDAEGYEIVLGKSTEKLNGEKRPAEYEKYVKKITGNTVKVTFKNVKKGVWYAGVRAWNRTTENGQKVYGPWSNIKTITVK